MRLLRARDLARSRFKANPYPFYSRLRVEAPVCRLAEMRLARPSESLRWREVIPLRSLEELPVELGSERPR
ncbi:MAG TPA: hypothetical protein VFM88_00645 [Vicinamibacteria bacterium]|nr:hypothetical protein [Vicinamibacteria bacterium]